MNVIKQWMRLATKGEQIALADKAGTTRAYLYHLAGGKDAKYGREPMPVLAAALEKASAEMHKANKTLPRIYRTDLVTACRQCEFAQKCLGAAAVRSDFPIVEVKKGGKK
jgi:hypothetical protein